MESKRASFLGILLALTLCVVNGSNLVQEFGPSSFRSNLLETKESQTRSNNEHPIRFYTLVNEKEGNSEKIKRKYMDSVVNFVEDSKYNGSQLLYFLIDDRTTGLSNIGTVQNGTYIGRLSHIAPFVINVLWTGSAKYQYNQYQYKVDRVQEATDMICDIILELKHCVEKFELSRVNFITEGIGAHIAGRVGRKFKGNIGSILAIDPARPLFEKMNKKDRLDKNDAKYVSVIHVNADEYGITKPIGNSDIFLITSNVIPPGLAASLRWPTSLQTYITKIFMEPTTTENVISKGGIYKKYSEQNSPRAYRCESVAKFLKGECIVNGWTNINIVINSTQNNGYGIFYHKLSSYSGCPIGKERGRLEQLSREIRITTTMKSPRNYLEVYTSLEFREHSFEDIPPYVPLVNFNQTTGGTDERMIVVPFSDKLTPRSIRLLSNNVVEFEDENILISKIHISYPEFRSGKIINKVICNLSLPAIRVKRNDNLGISFNDMANGTSCKSA